MVQRSIYNIGFQNRCYVEFVLSPVGIGTCAAIGLYAGCGGIDDGIGASSGVYGVRISGG